MNVNQKERLTNFPQMKAKRQCFDCCSTMHSHRMVFSMGIVHTHKYGLFWDSILHITVLCFMDCFELWPRAESFIYQRLFSLFQSTKRIPIFFQKYLKHKHIINKLLILKTKINKILKYPHNFFSCIFIWHGDFYVKMIFFPLKSCISRAQYTLNTPTYVKPC